MIADIGQEAITRILSGRRRLHVVSDLSGAWNPPELWPQSRAKADLGNAPKHQGFKSTQPSRACCRWASQDPPASKLAAGDRWQGAGLVFCTSVGTAVDAANVRRSFRRWPRPLAWTRRAPKTSKRTSSRYKKASGSCRATQICPREAHRHTRTRMPTAIKVSSTAHHSASEGDTIARARR
jgi:hypothetical protein